MYMSRVFSSDVVCGIITEDMMYEMYQSTFDFLYMRYDMVSLN